MPVVRETEFWSVLRGVRLPGPPALRPSIRTSAEKGYLRRIAARCPVSVLAGSSEPPESLFPPVHRPDPTPSLWDRPYLPSSPSATAATEPAIVSPESAGSPAADPLFPPALSSEGFLPPVAPDPVPPAPSDSPAPDMSAPADALASSGRPEFLDWFRSSEPPTSPKPSASPEPSAMPEPSVSSEPPVSVEPAVWPEPSAMPEPSVSFEPSASPEPPAPASPGVPVRSGWSEPNERSAPTDLFAPRERSAAAWPAVDAPSRDSYSWSARTAPPAPPAPLASPAPPAPPAPLASPA